MTIQFEASVLLVVLFYGVVPFKVVVKNLLCSNNKASFAEVYLLMFSQSNAWKCPFSLSFCRKISL